jgi:hypothetical protein
MLSDTVEAAVRSIPEPTQEKIAAMITKLVRGKMEDGQLDECTLTFRDIGKICKAYETVLKGVFHERIEYPTVQLNRGEGGNNAAAGKAVPAPVPQSSGPVQTVKTAQGTGPVQPVRPAAGAAQGTGPVPAVKPVQPIPQSTGAVPVVKPVSQGTGAVPLMPDDTMPAPYAAPLPDGDPVAAPQKTAAKGEGNA